MRSVLPIAAFLLFALADPAGAAEYTSESFNGVWRFDVERTRALCGDEEATVVAAYLAGLRVEMDAGGREKPLRVYEETGGERKYRRTLDYHIELAGEFLVLSCPEDLIPLRILDADSLLLHNENVRAVLIRRKPEVENEGHAGLPAAPPPASDGND